MKQFKLVTNKHIFKNFLTKPNCILKSSNYNKSILVLGEYMISFKLHL